LGLIGILWIFLNEILAELNLKTTIKNGGGGGYLWIVSIPVCIIIICLMTAIILENKISPYKGKYFEASEKIMLKIDTISDEELRIFQGGRPDMIRAGIGLLKKYNLGIFRPNKKNNDVIFYKGFYENKNKEVWISKNASIAIRNIYAGKFIIHGYCPESMPNNITVSINNNESASAEIIPGNSYNIEIDFENTDGIIYINIKTEKAYIPKNEGWNEDERELGAYIHSWELAVK
jgi:hypothetical protein